MITTILAIVIVFGGLFTAHEAGHYLVARCVGIGVDEFALGFGPRLAAIRRGETEFSLRLLPMLAYVRLAGTYPNERDGSEEASRSRRANASGRGWAAHGPWARAAVLLAGPLTSLLVAVLLVAFAFGALGVPGQPTLVVAAVDAGYPAQGAGVRAGDRLLAIDSQMLANWDQLHGIVARNPGRPLTFLVRRGERDLRLRITPKRAADGSGGVVGIRPRTLTVRLGLLASLGQGVAWTWAMVAAMLVALGSLLRGGGVSQLLGPVGIGQQIGAAARAGIVDLLFFAAALSANLGLFNLLPVPALDGSRLVFVGIEVARGRPVDPAKEGFVHLVGFAFILLLMFVITYHDVLRLNLG